MTYVDGEIRLFGRGEEGFIEEEVDVPRWAGWLSCTQWNSMNQ